MACIELNEPNSLLYQGPNFTFSNMLAATHMDYTLVGCSLSHRSRCITRVGKALTARGASRRATSLARTTSVTTQIPGNPKFGPWPQVKGLTLRVSPIPRWQSIKTLWFFYFILYISLEFSYPKLLKTTRLNKYSL